MRKNPLASAIRGILTPEFADVLRTHCTPAGLLVARRDGDGRPDAKEGRRRHRAAGDARRAEPHLPRPPARSDEMADVQPAAELVEADVQDFGPSVQQAQPVSCLARFIPWASATACAFPGPVRPCLCRPSPRAPGKPFAEAAVSAGVGGRAVPVQSAARVASALWSAQRSPGGLPDSGSAPVRASQGTGRGRRCRPGPGFRFAIAPMVSYRLAAALTLADRLNARRADQQMSERTISRPEDVVDALGPAVEHASEEELHGLYLSTRNPVVTHRMIYRGNVNSMPVRPAEVYRTAVVCNLPNMVLAHKHPGGNPCPSPEDKAVTQELSEAGRLLGVNLLRPHRHQPRTALGEHEGTRADGCVTACNRL